MDVDGLFGVIGHPIKHSLSPVMHNAVFKKLGLEYTYKAFDVPENQLKKKLDELKSQGTLGLNITIPHKINVIKHLDELSREARLIGAVNTIKFGEKMGGYNTDGLGCVCALTEAGIKLKDARVLILGAGGAARAVGFQCTLSGALLSLSNRESERYMAEELSADIKRKLGADVEVVTMNDESLSKALGEADVLIHATSVGMHPNVDASILDAKIIPEHVAVMDIVYNPIKTKLLKEAEKAGCKTIDGVGMLVHQGAESLKIWLGIDAPVDIMRKAVLEKLRQT